MTTIEQGASVTRKTKATIQHKALVVTLHAEFLELRRFGKRESLTATYESIYQAAAMRQAERDSSRTSDSQTEPSRERCAMTATSLYSLDCVCGRQLHSQSRDLVCPACGRQIHIEWPAKADEEISTGHIREKKRSAA